MNADLSKANWFKSSRSGGQTDCVEIAWLRGKQIGVRDSKNTTGPALVFAPDAWNAFTATVRDGRFRMS